MEQARIGIAISDEMEILASSVESYHCKGDVEADAQAVSETGRAGRAENRDWFAQKYERYGRSCG